MPKNRNFDIDKNPKWPPSFMPPGPYLWTAMNNDFIKLIYVHLVMNCF